MKRWLFAWIALPLHMVLSSCSQSFDNSVLLPPATGEAGEIILVMENNKWEGALGEEIRNTFRAPIPGLLQDEPKFNLIHIDPTKFNSVLKTAKNLIFVHTFEGNTVADNILKNYFTLESLEKIQDDPELFMHKQRDLFAKNQSVLYLFQVSSDALVKHIKNQQQQLVQYFLDEEKERFYKALYKAPRVKGIEQKLLEDHQCYLQVPYGYEIAVETESTIWIRRMDRKIDKNIFIAYQDYTSEKSFDIKQITRFRDKKWRRFILGNDSMSYMITEPLVPVDSTSLNIGKKFGVQLRGVWKLNNNSMGGPFVGYTFVDQAINRLYYVECFVYAPGENKRNPLRELETIISTFQTESEFRSSTL